MTTKYYWTKIQHGAASRLSDIPPGARIRFKNNKSVVGKCESCKRIILEDDKFYRWADGVITCRKHPPKKVTGVDDV